MLKNLKSYQEQIKNRIVGSDVEVADAGMVDNPVKTREAADFLKLQDVEIVSFTFQLMHLRQQFYRLLIN